MKQLILNNRTIVIETQEANSFKSRLLGYMFQKEPNVPSIVFTPCNSIHTFFMKFNIDVLFLDKDMRVLKQLLGVPPRKIIWPVEGAKVVIESKAGVFNNVKLGDKISLT